jgi:hypothetical protein
MAIDTPHFGYPFAFSSMGVADVNQQDTPLDIRDCVARIISCELGDCPDVHDFGIPSPLFANAPVDPTAIHDAIVLWEPRAADVVLVESEGLDDPAHRVITVEVH